MRIRRMELELDLRELNIYQWGEVIDVLASHGISANRVEANRIEANIQTLGDEFLTAIELVLYDVTLDRREEQV